MRNRNSYIVTAKQADKNHIQPFVTVVLLGENYGYRMKSQGPTPLIPIQNKKTVLELQVNAIKSIFANYEIILCSGFDTKKVSQFVKTRLAKENIRIVENQVHYNSNSCESLRLALNNTCNDKVLVLSGDLIFNQKYLKAFDYKKTSVVLQNDDSNKQFEISVLSNGTHVNSMCLGEKDNFWTEGVFLADQKSVSKAYEIVSNIEYKNKFIFEAMNELSKTVQIKAINTVDRTAVKVNNLKILKNIRSYRENINTKLFK